MTNMSDTQALEKELLASIQQDKDDEPERERREMENKQRRADEAARRETDELTSKMHGMQVPTDLPCLPNRDAHRHWTIANVGPVWGSLL